MTKRFITHLKNHKTVPNVAIGSKTNFIYINIIRTPAKNKVEVFQCFICEKKVFRENKILRMPNDNIHQDIKRFSCHPCGQIFWKKCTLNFHMEIKHPDHNMAFPEWSCEICKEPYPNSRA